MNEVTFEQRFGLSSGKPIINDFPNSAKIALSYVIDDLINRKYILEGHTGSAWNTIITEAYRISRIDSSGSQFHTFHDELMWLLEQTEWPKVFTFCERIYSRFLTDNYTQLESIESVRKYFSDEINQLLSEENMDYRFVGGLFERRGRAQTQNNIKKMGSILADSNLNEVRKHYNKALKFFNQTPEPDYHNCVKEALCAFECAIEICTGKNASNNFTQALNELEGSAEDEIPTPISQSMKKIYAYRGSGQGISHSALNGYRVTDLEAELVLNLVASYITYFVDLYPIVKDDLPF
ncbi:hypothetical protein NYE48_05055 [Paenibacillus sp. FSL M7-1455]|uniref:AbiJ-NTD4 domain-containing protein n=1 Tax=Paenibacillus sp. FSL M7-1455 TaxID=2975316 RepID=UPI0030F68534